MSVTNYYSVDGLILGEKSTGSNRVDYLSDALGSVTATVNNSAQVVNTYRYKPYGTQLTMTGTGSDPAFTWVGTQGYRQTGNSNSNVYIRARHYDSKSARWTTKDPLSIFLALELNRYGYAFASPTVYGDPSGLQPPDQPMPPPKIKPPPIEPGDSQICTNLKYAKWLACEVVDRSCEENAEWKRWERNNKKLGVAPRSQDEICAEIVKRILLSHACIAARRAVTYYCYDNDPYKDPNYDHVGQENSIIEKSIPKCIRFYGKKGCTGKLPPSPPLAPYPLPSAPPLPGRRPVPFSDSGVCIRPGGVPVIVFAGAAVGLAACFAYPPCWLWLTANAASLLAGGGAAVFLRQLAPAGAR